MATEGNIDDWAQMTPREARVTNNPGSWHNPTGEPLRQLSENVWVMERGYEDHRMDVGGKATIIRLSDGRLFVHSALPLNAEVKAQIDALGTVSAVVSGNTQHVDFVKNWKKYYPNATCIAPPGFMAKRTDVPFDAELSEDSTPHDSYKDDDGTIQQIFLPGCPVMAETAFFHVPSRTMVTTDTIFTFPSQNIPFGTRVANLMLRHAFKPVLWAFYVTDKAAYSQALEKVAAWDFETMVPCHGAIITEDAVEVFKRWHGLS